MMYTFCTSKLMYTKCIENVCIQNVSHISTNFCIHFAYKMYTKYIQNICIYTKCTPHFDKLLYTKCIENVYI